MPPEETLDYAQLVTTMAQAFAPDYFTHGFKVLHGWLAVEPGKVRPEFALDALREVIDWWATQCGTAEAVLTDDIHWCEDDITPAGFAIAGPCMACIVRNSAGVWVAADEVTDGR